MSDDKPTADLIEVAGQAFPKRNLVYQSDDFTIWLTDELDAWWIIEACFATTFKALQKRPEWAEIMTRQAELEALPTSHLSDELKRGFRFQIATALLLLFKEKFEEAKKAMQAAETFYRARTAERARIWMLQSGVLSVLVVTAPLLFTGWVSKLLVEPEGLFEQMTLGALAGIYGALTSLILRVSELGIDAAAGRPLHYAESMCRIFVGFVAGGVAVCAIAAGLVAPDLLKLSSATILIVGFTFGFSERVLPTLVGRMETRIGSSAHTSGKRGEKRPQG